MSESIVPARDYQDRRGGLLAFGILSILIGCACALLVPFMLFGQAMAAQAPGGTVSYRTLLPGVALYVGMAVTLIWLGIGSILCRRWARALLLILSWGWLLIGAVTVPILAWVMPQVFKNMPEGVAAPPAAMITVIVAVVLCIFAVLFLILPGAMVLFYRSRHVKATCEARDPAVRWTDACPLPVLGLSLLLGYGAAWMLLMPLCFNSVMPFFGRFLSGAPGTAVMLLLAGAWGWCAWAAYRLRPAAWWIVLAVVLLMSASVLVTFGRVDLLEMYRLMGYPEDQIKLIEQTNFFKGRALQIMSVSGSIPFLGFLLFVRKYFRGPPPVPAATPG